MKKKYRKPKERMMLKPIYGRKSITSSITLIEIRSEIHKTMKKQLYLNSKPKGICIYFGLLWKVKLEYFRLCRAGLFNL